MTGTWCRLMFDPPRSGPWNMAVDETLLHSAAAGRATLRFYTWHEATLSLGYFQSWQSFAALPWAATLPVVRRPSGGGAILHGGDLTYALAVCVGGGGSFHSRALYERVHQALVEALAELGVRATLAASPARQEGPHPVLCLESVAAADVLLSGVKVAGSAQRRRGGGLLQHGSVQVRPIEGMAGLGDREEGTGHKGLGGIEGLGGPRVDPMALARRWSVRISNVLGLSLEPGELDAAEQQEAQRLVEERYGAMSWTRRR
ncbi:MAG: lipoate--protein ligase family protein [Pirellulales bacterium]|nr:lipoate--protein ligase family protein [Pirellulales bacterium]